ncbi:MAG TPA: DUF6612 family protein, partial [Methanotrichaceae archaeon]|nr:DUF6612 family protein [Methanotrichaceae archaeon]
STMDIAIERILPFMMKLYPLILIVLLSIPAFGDDKNNVTALEELENATSIKELVIESGKNLETYRFSLTELQDMEVINTTDGEKIYEGQMQAIGAGAFNVTSRALKMAMATLSLPAGQEENATSLSTEVYFFNNTTYTKLGCNWTATSLPVAEDIWESQNRLEQTVNQMNMSDVRLLGIDEIEGKDLYKIEVVPKKGAFSALVKEQLGSSLPLDTVNISAILDNASIRYILWITKDSHLPEMEYVQMNMTASPEMLGLQGPSDQEVVINSTVTSRYSGFNESVNIALPDEAKNARIISLNDP